MSGLDRGALEEWCKARKTSIEVGEAIFEIASDDSDAQRIWESPTSGEFQQVQARAFAKISSNELHWGTQTITRMAL